MSKDIIAPSKFDPVTPPTIQLTPFDTLSKETLLLDNYAEKQGNLIIQAQKDFRKAITEASILEDKLTSTKHTRSTLLQSATERDQAHLKSFIILKEFVFTLYHKSLSETVPLDPSFPQSIELIKGEIQKALQTIKVTPDLFDYVLKYSENELNKTKEFWQRAVNILITEYSIVYGEVIRHRTDLGNEFVKLQRPLLNQPKRKENCDDLETQLETAQEEIKQLTHKLKDDKKFFENIIEENESSIKTAIETESRLKGELETLKTRLSTLKETNESLTTWNKEDLDSLKTKIEKLNAENSKLRIRQKESNEIISGLRTEHEKTLDNNTTLTESKKRQEKVIKEQELRIQSFITDFAEKENQFSATRKDLSILEERYEALKEINTRKHNTIVELRQQLESIPNLNAIEIKGFPDLLTELISADDKQKETILTLAATKINNELNEKDTTIEDLRNQLKKYKDSYPPFHTFYSTPNSRDNDHSYFLDNDESEMANGALVRHLGELFSREDKKSIPIFKSSTTDKLITDWLKEAERVAKNNDWDDSQKIKFFSDRFKGEAAEWHATFTDENDHFSYKQWKKALIERFIDEADLDNLKHKLQNLKQKQGQRTKAFVNKINTLYDSVYGKDKSISEIATRETQELSLELRKLRSEAKRKILLRGLDSKVKDELWPRMKREQSFDEICELAYAAESIVINKNLLDDSKKDSIIASIQETKSTLENEIELVKKQLQSLKTSQTVPQETEEKPVIAAIQPQSQKRPQHNKQPGHFSQQFNTPYQGQPRGRGYNNPRFQGNRPFQNRGRGRSYNNQPYNQYQQNFIPFQPNNSIVPYNSQTQYQNSAPYNSNQQLSYQQPQNPNQSNTYYKNQNQGNHNPALTYPRTCHNCKQEGHYISSCPFPKQTTQNQQQ